MSIAVSRLLKEKGVELAQGDIFVSRNPMALGRIIISVQKFWSLDRNSKYSHSGIITGPFTAQTCEARSKIGYYELDEYLNDEIMIGRHDQMNSERHSCGMDAINHHMGRRYPFHRILFHLFPPAAVYVNFGRAVCSEKSLQYLCGAGLEETWSGWTPANVEDMIRRYKHWNIIFEGVLG